MTDLALNSNTFCPKQGKFTDEFDLLEFTHIIDYQYFKCIFNALI